MTTPEQIQGGLLLSFPQRIPLVVTEENRDGSLSKDAKLVNCYCELDNNQNFNLYRRPGMAQAQNPPATNSAGLGMYWWNNAIYSIFGGPLGAPTLSPAATSPTGGSLAAGTYYYVVTALGDTGETIASNEVIATVTGSTSSVTLTWGNLAKSYHVFRGTTSGGESKYFTVTNAYTFTDTGAAGTSGTPPTSNTSYAGILYKNGSFVASGLDTTGGVYSFSSILGATPKLVLQNGKFGYAYDDTSGISANLHSINASYPEYTCKGLTYLNGATYVMQHFFGTEITPAVIWGSKVNSVDQAGDWDPLDFLTAQIEPDSGVYLAKQLVYVVAIKEWSTEFFFDAGNSTGSPLQSMQTNKISYGCASADSVQRIGDLLLWISSDREAGRQIIMLDNLRPKIVSTQEIERLLAEDDFSTVFSWQIKIGGHSFYVLTLKYSNITLAYDLYQNKWSVWTDDDGNYLPIVACAKNGTGNYLLQHEVNGFLYYAGQQYPDDNGSLIPITIVSPEMSFGTQRRKQMGMLTFLGDQIPGSTMSVSFSDDNYQTWSQPREVDMSLKLPNIPNCGTFRRRAMKIEVNHNLWWRLQAVEAQVSLGTI